MSKRRQLVRDCLQVACMVAVSLVGGWWAHGHSFADSRRIAFDFSKPFVLPRTHESIGWTPTPDTAMFLVGDRMDIFIQDGDTIAPLILDAIVMNQTKTNFGMLLPHGGQDLLDYATENGFRFIFRHSLSPTPPVTLKPYRG